MPKTDPDISASQQRVWLAVLGKHPGWNDHLDDIGLDTERLVAVKRHLYVEGVGGVINAGTWEALPEGERDDGFAHTFFWRQPDGMVIGRMWSSSDGKGRKKYPMIACAMCRGLPFSFVAGPLLERLRGLEETCRSVSTAAEVISAADRVRAEITDLASFVPELQDEALAGNGRPGAAAVLIESGAAGADGVGLQRVLYQIEREMGAFIRPDGTETASRSRSVEVRGQHIRVPGLDSAGTTGREHESIGLWCRLLLGKIDPLVPLFFAVKDGRSWVDVIVGELGPTPLTCLQGGTESHPLTSDIPFTIEDEIATRYRETFGASERSEVREIDPCFVDVPQDRLAPFLRPRRGERPSKADTNGQRRMLIVAAVVVVVIVIVVILGSVLGGGGGSGQQGESGDETGTAAETVAPDRDSSRISGTGPPDPASPGAVSDPAAAAQVARFLEWCEMYGSFYEPFVESLDRELAFRDPDLASSLRSAMDAAERAGDAIDPLASTPGRFRSLAALMENPPDDVAAPVFAETIETGLATIEAVRDAVNEGWSTRTRVSAIRGRTADGEFSPQIEGWLNDLGSANGSAVASAVGALSELADRIGAATEALDRFDRAGRTLSPVSSGEIGRLFSALEPASGLGTQDASPWLSGLAGRAETLADLGERAAGAAATGLPKVDPGLLAARLAQVGQPRSQDDTIAFVGAWIDAVSDPGLYLLDPGTDPRQRLAALPSIGELTASLATLRDQAENAETQELAGMLSAYESSTESLADVPWNEATRDRVAGETDDLVALAGVIAERIDAERRTRAVEAERYIARLRETPSVSTTGSESIDLAWRTARDAAIAAFEDSGDVVTLSRAIEASQERLAQLESGMPAIAFDADAFGPETDAVSAAAIDHREALLKAAIADATASDGGYSSWAESVETGVRSFGELAGAMDRWAIEQDGADAPTNAAREWLRSWPRTIVAAIETRSPVDAYAESLSSADASTLVRFLQGADQPPPVVRAAWSRIQSVDPGWLGDEASFRTDIDVANWLLTDLSEQESSWNADRDAIEASVREIITHRWIKAASSSDQLGFEWFADAARRVGLDEGELPARLRFNLFVQHLRTRITDGEPLDREGLLAELERAGADLTAHPGALAWVSAFADELAARQGREIDYRVIGPARAGWAVEPYDAGRRLVYTWTRGDEARRLAFRLVETPETGAFYLSESESPLWLMTEIALGGDSRDAVLSTLPADWDPLPDTRLGPRAWTWGSFRGERVIRRARSWVVRNDAPDRPFYPDGMAERVGRPSDEHPIQRVSARAAATIAATVGCRLPTADEWRAAAAGLGTVAPSESMNLRDETFDVRRAHTVSLGSGISVVWAEQQSFADGMDGVPGAASAESFPGSDGTLWFAEVADGPDSSFLHLVGNVAEFVLPDLDQTRPLGDRGGEVDAVTRSIASGGDDGVTIIGASALSPPSLVPDQAFSPESDPGERGFTDVGFRLAFSPGVEAPLVVVVGEMVRAAPFLRDRD